MITATYDFKTNSVRMECGIGELRVVQSIPYARYIIRQMNWPQIYPSVAYTV